MNVAILGASQKTDRYSYLALKLLEEHGHSVCPVHPKLSEIEGTPVYPDIGSLPDPIDTLTMYVNSERSTPLADSILKLRPRRVIFNPGTENPDLQEKLKSAGIECIEACTLVLLRSGQF